MSDEDKAKRSAKERAEDLRLFQVTVLDLIARGKLPTVPMMLTPREVRIVRRDRARRAMRAMYGLPEEEDGA
jgi:hypothetical protein